MFWQFISVKEKNSFLVILCNPLQNPLPEQSGSAGKRERVSQDVKESERGRQKWQHHNGVFYLFFSRSNPTRKYKSEREWIPAGRLPPLGSNFNVVQHAFSSLPNAATTGTRIKFVNEIYKTRICRRMH
jgi:hypothetical protein